MEHASPIHNCGRQFGPVPHSPQRHVDAHFGGFHLGKREGIISRIQPRLFESCWSEGGDAFVRVQVPSALTPTAIPNSVVFVPFVDLPRSRTRGSRGLGPAEDVAHGLNPPAELGACWASVAAGEAQAEGEVGTDWMTKQGASFLENGWFPFGFTLYQEQGSLQNRTPSLVDLRSLSSMVGRCKSPQ